MLPRGRGPRRQSAAVRRTTRVRPRHLKRLQMLSITAWHSPGRAISTGCVPGNSVTVSLSQRRVTCTCVGMSASDGQSGRPGIEQFQFSVSNACDY